MSEYVLPVEFARDNRWADVRIIFFGIGFNLFLVLDILQVRRYTEVIRKIAAEYGQSELTKDKYYELYNMGVSLLRTIDMLDPEKARRNDMTREVSIQSLWSRCQVSLISMKNSHFLIHLFLELKSHLHMRPALHLILISMWWEGTSPHLPQSFTLLDSKNTINLILTMK